MFFSKLFSREKNYSTASFKASKEFLQLRDTDQKEKPFFAAVDSAELERWDIENKGSLKQLDIKLMEMLLLALELAVGKEPPNTPLIVSYDKEKRLVVFLPKALPVDYEELKQNYNAQKLALQAA